MSAAPEDLDAIEAELIDADRLACPVCRFEQTVDNDACARCKTDLELLSHALREARDRRLALYRAIFDNDPVTALSHLHDVCQLTGATPELAVLRKLLRHGAVPVELLTPEEASDADERLTAYQPDEAAGLTPEVPAEEQAEADAYAALVAAEDEPLAQESEPPPAERGEAGEGPADEARVADDSEPPPAEPGEAGGGPAAHELAQAPPPSPAPHPLPLLQHWSYAVVAILLALALGVGLGRLTAPADAPPAPAPPAPAAGVIQWHMAPLPEPPAPAVPAPPAKPGP